ncbi:MAG: peptidase [Microvirga sp.]|jgi:murein DD-endopeptidase MepM/ murein hydrolase activator NlpD|nr:peptidase [Microvirga sp.]
METGSAQASYQAPAQPPMQPMQTASVQSQALPPIQSPSRANGGTQITVTSNDSLTMISQRYGVPASAILAANGMQNANQISPGTRLTIPAQGAAAPVQIAAAPTRSAPAPAAPAAQPKFRLVDASKNKAAVEVAEAPKRTRPGMATAEPVKTASASSEPLVSAPTPVVPQKVAALPEAQPVKAAPVAPPATAKAPVADPDQTASVSNDNAAGDFRWPARGRVIAGFGANGGNEGINIAVPEGTPVKATEAGTVTYAGSEVKGYGNLVLIRHENGFVSAYAHNGSLSVKRGEAVKRGQVIATSGQTGNVTSPQLHFEIRKGATPVDPMKHLGG